MFNQCSAGCWAKSLCTSPWVMVTVHPSSPAPLVTANLLPLAACSEEDSKIKHLHFVLLCCGKCLEFELDPSLHALIRLKHKHTSRQFSFISAQEPWLEPSDTRTSRGSNSNPQPALCSPGPPAKAHIQLCSLP